MATRYKALSYFPIARGAKINGPTFNRATDVSLDDAAVTVMTDFNEITPYSIEPTATIDDANDKMIACGVRLLFVCNTDGALLGLVTATDVLGEKPVRYLNEHGGRRDEILAQDIMTPHESLQVLYWHEVLSASVGDIVETMKAFGRQHILVVEPVEVAPGETIRGIFSTSQISRQLGMHIELAERANSFAEIEQAIASA